MLQKNVLLFNEPKKKETTKKKHDYHNRKRTENDKITLGKIEDECGSFRFFIKVFATKKNK